MHSGNLLLLLVVVVTWENRQLKLGQVCKFGGKFDNNRSGIYYWLWFILQLYFIFTELIIFNYQVECLLALLQNL